MLKLNIEPVKDPNIKLEPEINEIGRNIVSKKIRLTLLLIELF